MKKITVVLLIALIAVTAVFVGCSKEAKASETTKVGFVVINDENDLGYTWNFMNGMNAAVDKLNSEGYNVELLVSRNHFEDATVTDANIELAGEGCAVIFNNSYGFENYVLPVADDFPDVQFVSMTNCQSQTDGRDNTYNAFAAIYEGRYVAGIAAGMKLNEMISAGKITKDQAVVGYVGAYSFAEVISGMTSYFLGIRSVCPSATMLVQFVGSWGDATLEAAAAEALIAKGAVMISQHSDTTSPATTAAKHGVFHTGYNTDMTGQAPTASIISCRIDWTNYFYEFIKNVIDGKKNPSDFCGTMKDGDVKITALNTAIAAKGTQEAMDKAIADIKAGKLHVFDLSTFTIGGKTATNDQMYDGFAQVKGNATYDGYFHESEFQSAPYFVGQIDGITWLNSAF